MTPERSDNRTKGEVPKTAAEVAERLYQKLLNPKSSLDYSDPTVLIAEALTAFADERLESAAKALMDMYVIKGSENDGLVFVPNAVAKVRSLKSNPEASK